LQEILPSFSEAAREEVRVYTLNGTKDKDVAHRRQRNQQNDDNWNEREKILDGSSVVELLLVILRPAVVASSNTHSLTADF